MSAAHRFRSNLLAALAVLLICSTAHGQEYKIKLTRPQTVGDTYRIDASLDVKADSSFSIDGGAVQKVQQVVAIDLNGVVKVLEVDKNGQPTKVSCTVDTCLKDAKPLFDKGTVITAENDGAQMAITVKGTALDPELSKMLHRLLRTNDPKDPSTDDVMFGTTQPQKVGAWPLNSAAIAENLSRRGPQERKEDIKGKATLVGVKKVDGAEVLQIQNDAEIVTPDCILPDGDTLENSHMTVVAEGEHPIHDAAAVLNESMDTTFSYHTQSHTPDGKKVVADVSGSTKQTTTYTEMKK